MKNTGWVKFITETPKKLAYNYEVRPMEPTILFDRGYNFSETGLQIKLTRDGQNRQRIYMQFHIPTGIFACISHIAYFIDSNQVPGRMGALVTLYLITINSYNSLDAPPNRGFSYIEVWFVAIQCTMILGILEFGAILCFKKAMSMKKRGVEETLFQNIDFVTFTMSSLAFGLFVYVYSILE